MKKQINSREIAEAILKKPSRLGVALFQANGLRRLPRLTRLNGVKIGGFYDGSQKRVTDYIDSCINDLYADRMHNRRR